MAWRGVCQSITVCCEKICCHSFASTIPAWKSFDTAPPVLLPSIMQTTCELLLWLILHAFCRTLVVHLAYDTTQMQNLSTLRPPTLQSESANPITPIPPPPPPSLCTSKINRRIAQVVDRYLKEFNATHFDSESSVRFSIPSERNATCLATPPPLPPRGWCSYHPATDRICEQRRFFGTGSRGGNGCTAPPWSTCTPNMSRREEQDGEELDGETELCSAMLLQPSRQQGAS